jgi:hypothetical protein
MIHLHSIAWYAEIDDPGLAALNERYASIYGDPLVSSTRSVYLDDRGRRVFKVPVNMAGIDANYREDGHTDPDIPLASCRLVDPEAEFPVLEMEWVRSITVKYDELPDWVGWVDCGQVGYTDDGRLVAFDL